MNAFLLCAGFGTRMKPLTDETPKSLAHLGGQSIVDYLVDELLPWEALDAIHVVVNHRDAPAFRDWASKRRPKLSRHGIELEVHDDGVESPDESLGCMGDLAFLLNAVGIPPEGALVSGGDSLYRFPLAPLLTAYKDQTNQVLALYEPDAERRAKSSVLTTDGRTVTEVIDDPTGGSSERICPSWMLLRSEALETVRPYLDKGGALDKVGSFLNYLARNHSLQAIPLPKQTSLRLHCNTMDDLERARRIIRTEPRHLLDPKSVEDLT